MAESDWVDDDQGEWVDDDPETSMLESGARGLAQGASLGFADEITGGLESLFSDKTYEQARDESRANYAKAEGDNPKTFGAGQIGGGVASAFVPGLNAAKGIKGAMTLGGLTGLGTSAADSAGGMLADTAKGAGLGAAGGAVARSLPSLGGALKSTVDDIATAPLGQEGSRGLVAKGLDLTHRLGKSGNEMLDAGIKAITPSTGNAQADGLMKGLQRVGRYGVAGKVQGALDTMEHAPKVAQWAAGKASPMLEKASAMGPYAQELAQRRPQVYQSLMAKQDAKPYDKDQIMQKVQGTPFDQQLKSAAQRGDEAFNATYFVLQNNPSFREAMRLGDGPE